MTWSDEAQRRAVAHVFSGSRTFALVLSDGTEADIERQAGALSEPVHVRSGWGATTEAVVEFPQFAESKDARVEAIAVYDGPVRLALAAIEPVLVSARVAVVLRPGDFWVGLGE